MGKKIREVSGKVFVSLDQRKRGDEREVQRDERL
jgi:hypothetical protein